MDMSGKRIDIRFEKADVRLSGVDIMKNKIILSGTDNTQLQQTICF